MVCVIVLLSFVFMVLTTPVHEVGHVVLSTLDPCLEVSEFYPFGSPHHSQGHMLPSMLGCVVVTESYPGAFQDRSVWSNVLQEIICLSLQLVITVVASIDITLYLVRKKLL